MNINPTMAAILGLLHSGPMTGGQVNEMAQKWLSPYWNVTRSQVYRELPYMESLGFVKSGKSGPRNSLPYQITASGKRRFKVWLKESPAPDAIRSESLLRISFGHLMEDGGLPSLLEKMREEHEAALENIRLLSKEAADGEMIYDRKVLKFMYGYHASAIRWLHMVSFPTEE